MSIDAATESLMESPVVSSILKELWKGRLTLATYIGGIFLALFFARRHTRPAILVFLGCVCGFLTQVATTSVSVKTVEDVKLNAVSLQESRDKWSDVYFFSQTGYLISMALMMMAAFASRPPIENKSAISDSESALPRSRRVALLIFAIGMTAILAAVPVACLLSSTAPRSPVHCSNCREQYAVHLLTPRQKQLLQFRAEFKMLKLVEDFYKRHPDGRIATGSQETLDDTRVLAYLHTRSFSPGARMRFVASRITELELNSGAEILLCPHCRLADLEIEPEDHLPEY